MLFQPPYYSAQERLPWAASWKSPKIKIKITRKIKKNLKIVWAIIRVGIAGKIKINSTSKTRKIIESIKNRMENGSRAEDFGVNPHSNGLDFSRSWVLLLLNLKPTSIKSRARPDTIKKLIKSIIKKSRKNNLFWLTFLCLLHQTQNSKTEDYGPQVPHY